MGSYPQDNQPPRGRDCTTAGASAVVKRRSHATQGRVRRQFGNAIIEFAVVIPFIAIAFFGTVSFGMVLGRYVEVVQVCRDLAHMYTDGVDFSQAGAKAVAVQLASGTGMTASGGDGVVILSRVQQVYQADCTAAGFGPCPNAGLIVFTQRLTIGNKALRTSGYGTRIQPFSAPRETSTPAYICRTQTRPYGSAPV